jgi:HAE1 family hydrophobic/amphiphilic exporter-1
MSVGAGPLSVNHSGAVAIRDLVVQPEARVSLGDAVTAVEDVARRRFPTASAPRSRARPSLPEFVQGVVAASGHGHRGHLHRAGILYESFIHPLTILSGLPSRVSARF